MLRILYTIQDALLAAWLLIPIAYLFNRYMLRNTKKAIILLLFAVYLSAVYAVAGLPNIRFWCFHPRFNLRPFAYMFSDYTNSFLNILLFIPLGVFMPILRNRFQNPICMILFGLGGSLLIEFMQIFTHRASDVNDLMTNTLGTLLGWLAAKLIIRFFPNVGIPSQWKELGYMGGSVFAVMFFLHPYLSELAWNCFH